MSELINQSLKAGNCFILELVISILALAWNFIDYLWLTYASSYKQLDSLFISLFSTKPMEKSGMKRKILVFRINQSYNLYTVLFEPEP